MRTIDCVLFDLDDTLHDDTLAYKSAAERVAREVAAEHGVDALALKAAYVAEAEGFWKRLSSRQLRTRLASVRTSLWASALGRVGLHDPLLAHSSADRYNRYRTEYLALFDGVPQLLRALRERGVRLGLLTNGFSETHREKIAVLRVGEYFDAIFIADEVGMLKPDPLLFAHACTKLERPPASSAMVGDRYERDIAGAAQAGLATIWLNARAEVLPPDAAAPDATVRTFGEVARILLGEWTLHER